MIELDKKQIESYAKNSISGTGYLAFRDLEYFSKILNKCNLEKVLDLGCGNGRSTKYISNFCKDVYGTDISDEMMRKFKENNSGKGFLSMNDGACYKYSPYSAIFCILVFFHVENLTELEALSRKIKDSLDDGGKFIAVIGNQYLYNRNYSTVSGIPKCKPNSGEQATIKLKDIEIRDTYWSVEDIIKIFSKNGFLFRSVHKPLASFFDENNFGYKDEYFFPPYSYLCFERKSL